jgi:hypothetical protein
VLNALKSYNRNNPVLNTCFNLNRPITNAMVCFWFIFVKNLINRHFQVEMVFYRKDASGAYVRNMFFPKVEWCKIVKGINSNPFYDNVVSLTKVYAKDLLEICSRTGIFKVSNLTFTNSAFVSQWPDGDFKLDLKVFDDIDLNIYYVSFTLIIAH